MDPFRAAALRLTVAVSILTSTSVFAGCFMPCPDGTRCYAQPGGGYICYQLLCNQNGVCGHLIVY